MFVLQLFRTVSRDDTIGIRQMNFDFKSSLFIFTLNYGIFSIRVFNACTISKFTLDQKHVVVYKSLDTKTSATKTPMLTEGIAVIL